MNAILSRGGILAALLSTALIAPAHASSININTDGSWNSFDVDEFMSASGGLECEVEQLHRRASFKSPVGPSRQPHRSHPALA